VGALMCVVNVYIIVPIAGTEGVKRRSDPGIANSDPVRPTENILIINPAVNKNRRIICPKIGEDWWREWSRFFRGQMNNNRNAEEVIRTRLHYPRRKALVSLVRAIGFAAAWHRL